MGEKEDVAALKTNIATVYNRKRSAVYALCKMYAGLSLQRFRQKQAQDAFFHNRTNTAYNSIKSDAELTKEYCEFFLALTVEYGIYLELANNRAHESIRPTVMSFYSRFMRDLEAIFAD
jgi:hypothetical protein